jgi:Short C-terminal domain
MPSLSPHGQQVVGEIASRYRLSFDAVACMLDSVMRGNGTMAQFNIQELGGSGQWMQGGMTMVGDMFNYGLQNQVASLCSELAPLINDSSLFMKLPDYSPQSMNWWPAEFGSPNSSGGQNDCRYAYFANSRRLVVDIAGDVWIYDTLNHMISGVSQQQGGGTSWVFTSQFGTVNLGSLPVVAKHVQAQPIASVEPSNQNQSSNQNQTSHQDDLPQSNLQKTKVSENTNVQQDTIELLRKLGELRDAGVLTENEFQSKKSEMLSRI